MAASQTFRQRIGDDPTTTQTKNNSSLLTGKSKRQMRMTMAKRGLRSLAVAVSFPVSLTLMTVYLGSSSGISTSYGSNPLSHPFWFPPLWAVNVTSLASSFLMGLSAWLVWADGGFHEKPIALSLYMTDLGLSLVWYILMFGAEENRVGLVASLGKLMAMVSCSREFTQVNPLAGYLVKLCLAWTSFLTILNFKLVSL